MAIVIFIAKQPAGYAPVIVWRWTLEPSCRAVLQATQMGRLVGRLRVVGPILAIIIAVALPQLRYAFTIGTLELSLRITFSLMTYTLVLVASIRAIIIRVADPRIRNATARLFAFERMLAARAVTESLIVLIRAIRYTIANAYPRYASRTVGTLIHAGAAIEVRAVSFVALVSAVRLGVTFPIQRYAFLVRWAAAMVAASAVGCASLVVRVEHEVVRTGAPVILST